MKNMSLKISERKLYRQQMKPLFLTMKKASPPTSVSVSPPVRVKAGSRVAGKFSQKMTIP